ncbi:MAG TPA: HYR domain-containing protein [Verrucomicrobiae bacterium]|nr:HYR domain-containing protein [Verrucomicrobiae bacterium]
MTLYLPEGTYTLHPAITTVDPGGGESITQLPAIEVSVVAGEKLCLEDCLRLVLTGPTCTPNFGFLMTADAFSCEATLTNLSLRASPLEDPSIRLGYSDIRILEPVGIARTTLRTAHGLFPAFDGINLALYSNIVYTAEARDNKGRVARRQFLAHYDFTPPALECPADIVVTAPDGVGAQVGYTFTATDDRPEPLYYVATFPPSGSLFPIGTTLVTCIAADLCRNTNRCTFQVTVLPPECPLRIELTQVSPRQAMLSWDCDGALQSAPGLEGPWTDVTSATSPYVTDPTEPEAYYRLKFLGSGNTLQFH